VQISKRMCYLHVQRGQHGLPILDRAFQIVNLPANPVSIVPSTHNGPIETQHTSVAVNPDDFKRCCMAISCGSRRDAALLMSACLNLISTVGGVATGHPARCSELHTQQKEYAPIPLGSNTPPRAVGSAYISMTSALMVGSTTTQAPPRSSQPGGMYTNTGCL
jgi:hypothetical protein